MADDYPEGFDTDPTSPGYTGPHCIQKATGECSGKVEHRMSLSGTGKAIPRCDKHWEDRLKFQEEHNRRYPVLPPADFDPLYAGESWDEE